MDAISYSYADKQAKRIKKFINDPDSTSGVVTVPKTIASGENITIPSGRVAVLPNVQIDGTLNVQGEVFIPSGATMSKVVEKVTSTDNAVVRFDGANGVIQNSGVTIDDNGNVNMNGSIANTFTAYGVSGANKGYVGDGNWLFSGSVNDFGIRATNNLVLGIGATEKMRIDTAGNVGIGGVVSGTTLTGFIENNFGLVMRSNGAILGCNVTYNSGWKYVGNGFGSIIRFDNTFGEMQFFMFPNNNTSGAGAPATESIAAIIDRYGNFILRSGTGGLGYGTGAGGTVTQLTSKSTSVTLNKPTGLILTSNSSLAAGATIDFIVNNSLFLNTDLVVIMGQDYSSRYRIETHNGNNNNGLFNIRITNTTASAYADIIKISFAIIKGATA